MAKTPGRDGHGIKGAGRRVERQVPGGVYDRKNHKVGDWVRFPDGALYRVGKGGQLTAVRPAKPVTVDAEVER